jgi:hypothetical protein
VGPRIACAYEELSEVEALFELSVVTSYSSNIPEGADIELFELFPYREITNAPSTVVVIEGAAISLVLALYSPP